MELHVPFLIKYYYLSIKNQFKNEEWTLEVQARSPSNWITCQNWDSITKWALDLHAAIRSFVNQESIQERALEFQARFRWNFFIFSIKNSLNNELWGCTSASQPASQPAARPASHPARCSSKTCTVPWFLNRSYHLSLKTYILVCFYKFLWFVIKNMNITWVVC